MRTAIIKQLLDTLGPWSTVRWEDTSPEGIFEFWPSRGMHYEMTTLLGADWYVVPQQRNTDYTYDSVLRQRGKAEVLRKYTKDVVEVSEIPFDSYDLVIATDPIFRFPPGTKTLFAYFLAEHWDWRYAKSLRRPLKNADLFLAHMMDAPTVLSRLPQAVAFPYVRDPRTMRAVFASQEREDAVWADWRMLMTLGAAENSHAEAASENAAQRLEEVLGIKVAHRPYSMGLYHGEDPPRWGDTAKYFRQLGKQKYYLCLGRAGGAGQGLGDAASLGCVCFGEQDKAYHRMLCHSETLCGDLQELPHRFKRVRASSDLQLEIRAWQDGRLRKHFVEGPLQLLQEAAELKRKDLTARGILARRAAAIGKPKPQVSAAFTKKAGAD